MIRIVEVGPRDGLQNEAKAIPTEVKLTFIHALAACGLREIEATSFVSPKWVPQLADAEELWPRLGTGALYSALVPNARGLERALACGVRRIAVFTAASEAFTQANIRMSIDESLAVFAEVVEGFRAASGGEGFVRGYISTAFECPYSGRVEASAVMQVARRLLELGVDEISVGDTIGVAGPSEVRELGKALLLEIPAAKVAWHFHDTNGTAIANVAEALRHGFSSFDSSAGGLGGCPYAPGAGGNLATEDLVYFLHREGLPTGVDLDRLALASRPISAILGRLAQPKSAAAALSRLDASHSK